MAMLAGCQSCTWYWAIMHFILWFAIDLHSERGETASRKAFYLCLLLDVVTFETGSMLGLLSQILH
jgi:hypothetical protein